MESSLRWLRARCLTFRIARRLLLGAFLLSLTVSIAPADSLVHKDLVYAKAGDKALRLDLYLPNDTGRPAPVLIWIHGGAWQMGSKTIPYSGFFTDSGFAVASIDYRLTNAAPFPAQIFDCKAAVRWLRANASSYRLDPQRLVAIGSSAGGHLAALLGATPDDPRYEGGEGVTDVSSRVQAVCDFSGPSDLLTIESQYPREPAFFLRQALDALLGGTVAEKPDLARLASPALQVTAKACPFFIAHGARDTVVPPDQSRELYQALRKSGVAATLQIVPDAGHVMTDPAIYASALAFIEQLPGW